MVRSHKHLRYEKEQLQGEIKTYLRSCEICKTSTNDNFETVLKKLTDKEAKINKSLIIKKENPQLNKNLFNKVSFFTLNIYYLGFINFNNTHLVVISILFVKLITVF